MAFPLPFGFVPGTLAEDGDPLDALVLVEEPTYPGIWLEGRLLGVIEAEQDEEGQTIRNDRLLTAAVSSRRYGEWHGLSDLEDGLVDDVIEFFTQYHARMGGAFRTIKVAGAVVARRLVEEAAERSDKKK